MRQCCGGKTEVKTELAKCGSRWQDDNKIDSKEISCADVHLLSLVRDRGQWKGCCEYGDEYSASVRT
jgi:hypothetical protein